VIPLSYNLLARVIHQERIQAAQASRPEWMYTAAPHARTKRVPGGGRDVRRWVARGLHQLAERVGPSDVAWQGES
jgi:hypothetical protein